MSIVISNITPEFDWDINDRNNKPDLYAIRINQHKICEFSHTRKADGLAQCLRDAADAIEKAAPNYTEQIMAMLQAEEE